MFAVPEKAVCARAAGDLNAIEHDFAQAIDVMDDVVAVGRCQNVGVKARPAFQPVPARASFNYVVARSANEDVVAASAEEPICAVVALQAVIASLSFEEVVAAGSIQAVVLAVPGKKVIRARAEKYLNGLRRKRGRIRYRPESLSRPRW